MRPSGLTADVSGRARTSSGERTPSGAKPQFTCGTTCRGQIERKSVVFSGSESPGALCVAQHEQPWLVVCQAWYCRFGEDRVQEGFRELGPPEHTEVAAADLGATWKAKLCRRVCVVAAVAHVVAPLLSWLIIAAWPLTLATVPLTGIFIGIVGYAPRLSTRARSVALVSALFVTTITVAVDHGYGPSFSGSYCVLVVTAGLLLGARAMIVLILSIMLAFLAIAGAIQAGSLAFGPSAYDANQLGSWLGAAVVYGTASLALVAIVRFASRTVEEAYDRVALRRRQVARWREAAQEARTARIAAERSLRQPQKLQAVAQLSGGLAHLFNNALTVARAWLEYLEEDPSLERRRAARPSGRGADPRPCAGDRRSRRKHRLHLAGRHPHIAAL